jgi:hypothetical protein
MKLSEFILLDEVDKKFSVVHTGVLIGKRKTSKQMVFLFQMDNYYVETYCNINNKQVEEYRVFSYGTQLNPWLELISLDNLVM